MILSATLLLALPLPQVSQGGTPRTVDSQDVIHYDYVENGVLTGGVVAVDPENPWHTDIPDGTAELGLAPDVTTIVDNGPPANRVDIVFVGDGYTTGEIGDYASDIDSIWPVFFSEHPFDTYAPYFNLHRVDVISNESGVDNDPNPSVSKDTALDMKYFCSGTERLLCVNVNKANIQAAHAPDIDQVLAVANSSKYGGAGYSDLGTLAGSNFSSIEVALHEFGHSFGDLADEYTYGGSTTYSGPEPGEKNASKRTAAGMLLNSNKWFRWLDLPHVDTYEGCKYSRYGIYRPTNNSKMRSLGRPFEEINAERLIRQIYLVVDPIDDATAEGIYPVDQVLSVTPMQPIGHSLSVQWRVNGFDVPGATGNTFDPLSLGLPRGVYRVKAVVRDETPAVRNPWIQDNLMTSTRRWTVYTDGRLRPVDGFDGVVVR